MLNTYFLFPDDSGLSGSNFLFFLKKSSRLIAALSMCLTFSATFSAPALTVAPAALSSAAALLSEGLPWPFFFFDFFFEVFLSAVCSDASSAEAGDTSSVESAISA